MKAGLLLALFGGSQSDEIDNRAESHVLVVGDPGLGKSQMLKACSFIAPRGMYVIIHLLYVYFIHILTSSLA